MSALSTAAILQMAKNAPVAEFEGTLSYFSDQRPNRFDATVIEQRIGLKDAAGQEIWANCVNPKIFTMEDKDKPIKLLCIASNKGLVGIAVDRYYSPKKKVEIIELKIGPEAVIICGDGAGTVSMAPVQSPVAAPHPAADAVAAAAAQLAAAEQAAAVEAANAQINASVAQITPAHVGETFEPTCAQDYADWLDALLSYMEDPNICPSISALPPDSREKILVHIGIAAERNKALKNLRA